MEKVRPWCGQLTDRGWLKNRSELLVKFSEHFSCRICALTFIVSASEVTTLWRYTNIFIIIIIIIIIIVSVQETETACA